MRIGAEEFTIQPEPKKALDSEILFLNLLVYAVVLAYAFGHLIWPVFYLLFHLAYMRVFIGNHDRFHTDASRHWPRPIEFIAEHFALVVTPWDEPYDSIRKKHLTHHVTHLPNKIPGHDVSQDPHCVYEAGGFWRALLHCAFYEEVQLFSDIRNNNITASRWIRLAIYLPLQVLFIMTFGWEKYLGVFAAMRLVSAGGWFAFSWGLHNRALYHFGFVREVPKSVIWLFGVLNGKRVRDGFFRHAAHHAWPQLPSSRLDELDSAVLRNPNASPEMIATN